MGTEENRTANLRIDQDLWARVKVKADAEGMKLYAVVERALEAYLKNGEVQR